MDTPAISFGGVTGFLCVKRSVHSKRKHINARADRNQNFYWLLVSYRGHLCARLVGVPFEAGAFDAR